MLYNMSFFIKFIKLSHTRSGMYAGSINIKISTAIAATVSR